MRQKYPFKTVPFNQLFSSFRPYIDPETMRIHYNQIYTNAVDSLNSLIEAFPQFKEWTLEDLIVRDINQVPVVPARRIKYFAGAVYNHDIFFEGLDSSRSMLPYGNLLDAIEATYGSFDSFKALFIDAARSVMGVGWVWLNSEGGQKVHIAITDDNRVPAINILNPVLNLDVWEHAYFLQYPGDVGTYATNWFEVVDWGQAEYRYNGGR